LDIQKQIERGISILKRGGIVAYPTDTVYGLGASIQFPGAIERIFEVKARPRGIALPLLLSSVSQISEVSEHIPPVAWLLIKRFLPGALTIILFKSSSVPDIVTAGGRTVGIRIPAHPVPIALIKGAGAPIVGTSANLSGLPSPLTADDVRSQLGDKIDLVIDGGKCPGKESTIIDVTRESPVIVREGAISLEEIEGVCGTILTKQEVK
jgi:L-threonylcarbamoyladenylate synthase